MDKYSIDNLDREILNLLIEDSRISYSNLATKLNMTRTPVQTRVKEMVEKGVIEKFTVLVPAKYMDKPFPVFFDISTLPNKTETIAEQIAAHESIYIIYQMSGGSTLHVHGYFKDVSDVSFFVNDFLSKLNGITNIKSEFIIKRYKVNRSLLV